MPEVTWTNCAEQMPPPGDQLLIVKDMKNKTLFDFPEGINLSRSFNVTMRPDFYSWTPYTKEKWEYLNNEN